MHGEAQRKISTEADTTEHNDTLRLLNLYSHKGDHSYPGEVGWVEMSETTISVAYT